MKSRSNSRGSILDDIFVSPSSRNQPSPSTLSLATVLGNTDYENVLGPQTFSFLQGFHKLHESTCKYALELYKIINF